MTTPPGAHTTPTLNGYTSPVNGHTPQAMSSEAPVDGTALLTASEGVMPVVARLRTMVKKRLDDHGVKLGRPLPPHERAELVDEYLVDALDADSRARMQNGQRLMPVPVQQQVRIAVRDRLLGLGGFEQLFRDPTVETINANGFDRVFVARSDGRRQRVAAVADSNEDLIRMIREAAIQAGRDGGEERRWDSSSPTLALQLPGGQRLQAIMTVSRVPSISIRCFRVSNANLNDLCQLAMVNELIRDFLAALVRAHVNIVISGGLGVGKTTLARALAAEMPESERKLTVEDVFELNLDLDDRHPDTVALQTRGPNLEGRGEIDQYELVRTGLRMSADRVIVGETRGSEVIPMLQAMSQGNDGSIGTIHARSSHAVPNRMVTYALLAHPPIQREATIGLLEAALPVIVHVDFSRGPGPRSRVISSIREITGMNDAGTQVASNEVFKPDPRRRAIPTGVLSRRLADLLEEEGFDPRHLASGIRGPAT